MAMTNLYPNLPGHLVEFKDGGLQLVQTDDIEAGAKSLLILGTGFDGPVMEPVRIDDKTVVTLFGSDVDAKGYPNGATLTKYAKQAFRNGFKDVRCMRVTGKQAELTISKETETNEYDVEVDVASVLVPGNDAASIDVEGPICLDPAKGHDVSIKRIVGGQPVTTYGYSAIDAAIGEIEISAGLMPAGSQIEITYDKYEFDTSHSFADDSGTVPEAGEDDGNSYSVIVPNYYRNGYIPGLQAGENNVPDVDTTDYADGPKVVLLKMDGNNQNITLTKDTDYTVTEDAATMTAKIDFILSSDTMKANAGAMVIVEYVSCTIVPVVKTLSVEGSDIVVTADADIFDVTVTVKNTGEEVPFEVSGDGPTIITIDQEGLDLSTILIVKGQMHVVEDITESFIIRSIYGGSVYNYAKVSVEDADASLGKPEGTKKIIFTKPAVPTTDSTGAATVEYPKNYGASDLPFFWYTDVVKTVGMLRNELANYNLNNVFEIVCDDENMTLDGLINVTSNLAGGDDGVNPTADELFQALSGIRYRSAEVGSEIDGVEVTSEMVGYLREQGAYQLLENYHVDYVYPAGVYAGMESSIAREFNTSFHHELCLLCAVLTYRTKMTHGFIDAKQNMNTTLKGVQKYVDSLVTYDNLHYMSDGNGNPIVDSEGNMMDIGWYTSLVVGPAPIMTSDTLGTYYGSPAIAYAALCARIAVQSAPTNKALPNVRGMAYKMSNKQMDALAANHMVVFKNKGDGMTTATTVPYVVDGCTCGGPNCDYQRISTVKIVTDVVDQVREVADPFLGEPNTIEQRNALAALISKRLSYLLEQGEIMDYEFEINATIEQVLLGECSISLVLSVPMELRRITTVVALRAAA